MITESNSVWTNRDIENSKHGFMRVKDNANIMHRYVK